MLLYSAILILHPFIQKDSVATTQVLSGANLILNPSIDMLLYSKSESTIRCYSNSQSMVLS
jgi:hypothetical protein